MQRKRGEHLCGVHLYDRTRNIDERNASGSDSVVVAGYCHVRACVYVCRCVTEWRGGVNEVASSGNLMRATTTLALCTPSSTVI